MPADYEYGVESFYLKLFEKMERKTYNIRPIFGKQKTMEKAVVKKIEETNGELWLRINDAIGANNWIVVNIEAIVGHRILEGNGMGNYIMLYNDSRGKSKIVGYRIFYKKQLPILPHMMP
jgi:hypothetical protein